MPPARVALYVTTIGALALLARSLIIAPIPTWAAVAALLAYVAVVTAGTLWLRLGMFADVTWRGPKKGKRVALTFDDGPSPEYTPRVLDLLDEAKAKATFFVIGKKAEAHPDLVREIRRRGHGIGVHSYAHDRLFSLRTLRTVRDDLTKAVATLERITGERPTLFRPPIGHTNPRIVRAARDLGLAFVGWSVRGVDGLAASRPERVAARVAARLGPGAIVLLHDAAEREDHAPAGVAALPGILEAIRDKGLSPVTVDRFVRRRVRKDTP